jgi:hypothetical protein
MHIQPLQTAQSKRQELRMKEARIETPKSYALKDSSQRFAQNCVSGKRRRGIEALTLAWLSATFASSAGELVRAGQVFQHLLGPLWF